jgi:multidrug resistance efflux pump
MIDVFAWIVLLILVASAIAIFFIAGLAARTHRQKPRTPLGAGCHHSGMGHVDLRLCAVAARIDLGLCRHSRGPQGGGAAMIVALFNVYLVILFFLVKFKIVPFNLFWKVSPLIVLLLLMFGLFVPMGWGAPQGPALVVRNSVAVVPNVAGEVTDVPVEPNKPLRAGDVLFKIDPIPYQAQVDTIGAQLKFKELRLSQMTQLQLSDAGRAFDVEQRQADVDKLKGQFLGAKYNLEQTVVRAPSDGYVTNLGLIKGARVASLPLSPVMAFIDTSETVVGVEIAQIYTRYIEPGQEVEVTFKIFPGQVYKGKVDTVLQATSTGQVLASGTAVTPRQVIAAPFVVRLKLDDAKLAARLPAGTAGDAAIYTSHIKPSHIIRKVILRQIAIVNYVNPF